jgi:hypothetical protein
VFLSIYGYQSAQDREKKKSGGKFSNFDIENFNIKLAGFVTSQRNSRWAKPN